MPATDNFVRIFILRSQINTIGSSPRTQSAVKDTAEWAILRFGMIFKLIHEPLTPAYWPQKNPTGLHWKTRKNKYTTE